MTEELVTAKTAELARDKGFDEVCRDTFELILHDGENPVREWRPVTVVATKLSDLDRRAREMLVDRPGLWDSPPCQNSKLAQWILARPTQDLLEKWLREKKEVHGYIKITRGSKKHNIPTLYLGGYYDSLDEGGGKWDDDKAFQQHRDARENWLYHALKQLK